LPRRSPARGTKAGDRRFQKHFNGAEWISGKGKVVRISGEGVGNDRVSIRG